jgi:hypothetical protein
MTGGGREVDHVVLGVADLDRAQESLSSLGLAALPGGTHPAWGTANRIVPLGGSYLELVAVVDPGVAAGSAFGSWIAAIADGSSAWGWAVRTPTIDDDAERLGLDVVPGSRVRPDGSTLAWRLAGVADAGSGDGRPFLIAWDDDASMPGRAPVDHPHGPAALSSLVVAGDRVALERWVGGAIPGVHVVPPGTSGTGVVEVVVQTAQGSVVLHPSSLG